MDPLNLPRIAGDDYLVAMRRRREDLESRAAFTRAAELLLPPGGHVFDFGCGPGLDAQHYAARGYRVTGYDVDARMRDTFERLCLEPLRNGQVVLDAAPSYEAFLAARGGVPADLVTANFAPLNLVESPRAVFEKFASLLAPGGQVLASVLNPGCLRDARYGWWWAHLPALALRGEYVVGEGRVHRRTPRRFAREARGCFRLAEVMPAGGPGVWQRMARQYLFLRFERA